MISDREASSFKGTKQPKIRFVPRVEEFNKQTSNRVFFALELPFDFITNLEREFRDRRLTGLDVHTIVKSHDSSVVYTSTFPGCPRARCGNCRGIGSTEERARFLNSTQNKHGIFQQNPKFSAFTLTSSICWANTCSDDLSAGSFNNQLCEVNVVTGFVCVCRLCTIRSDFFYREYYERHTTESTIEFESSIKDTADNNECSAQYKGVPC